MQIPKCSAIHAATGNPKFEKATRQGTRMPKTMPLVKQHWRDQKPSEKLHASVQMSNAHPKNEAGNQRPRRRRPRQGAGRKRRKKARNEEGAGRKRSKKARNQEGRPRRIGRRLRNAPEIGPRERYRKVRILPTNL